MCVCACMHTACMRAYVCMHVHAYEWSYSNNLYGTILLETYCRDYTKLLTNTEYRPVKLYLKTELRGDNYTAHCTVIAVQC